MPRPLAYLALLLTLPVGLSPLDAEAKPQDAGHNANRLTEKEFEELKNLGSPESTPTEDQD